MKMHSLAAAAFAAAIFAVMASCAGAPKPTETAQPTPPVAATPAEPTAPAAAPAVSAEELAAARARAEKARKSAFDLGAPDYFKDEWKAADATFLAGREKETSAAGEALKAYTDAATAFEDLAGKSVPRFAEESRANLDKARALAVSAGADREEADRLATADKAAAASLALWDSGDRTAAIPAILGARDAYLALVSSLEARKVKALIDERGFIAADPSNYQLASDKLAAALVDFDAAAMGSSRDKAEESRLRFNLAYQKGQELVARTESDSALERKKSAEESKANVAVKQLFEEGVATMAKADEAFAAGGFEDAAALYAKARETFASARETALDKRRKAEAAMADADRKLSESLETARQGDAVLEGGKR